MPSPGSTPERDARGPEDTIPARLRHARLVAEREALAAVIPRDPTFAYQQAKARVRDLESRLNALVHGDGWGVLRGTPVGQAAVAWRQAADEWGRCLHDAEHAGLRERHQLHRLAAKAAKLS